MSSRDGAHDYDVVVIGSGFGGSVAALRLTEKGYRVAVLEAGRRFADEEFAKTSWDLRNFLWAPQVGCYGIQRIHLLRDVLILAGSGVGGGSLVYANTLYRPLKPFYSDSQWAHITDWEDELAPHYDQASRMLGVVTNPTTTPSDVVIREVAEEMGVGESYHPTPVGVYFGKPGEQVADPYFGGAGPSRTGCTECGSCMTGCRVGAKNTLVKNYLHLAEAGGAEVWPLTTVHRLAQGADGRWRIGTRRTGARFDRDAKVFTADQVVVAAGTWGTQNLLHRARERGDLPRMSERLGVLTRTNSEAIIGAQTSRVLPGKDFSTGVAITSSFHPDEDTHIEPVRYGKGSNAMGMLQTLPTSGGSPVPRWKQWLRFFGKHPLFSLRLLWVKNWSERTVILLVMQSLDNSLTTKLRKGIFGRRRLTSQQGHGAPNPTCIPAGEEANNRVAEKLGGIAGGTWGELLDMPMTAHFIGGCPIGQDAEHGVVDPYHRAFGYPTMSIVDGSAISANLGVNPSLTITAQAERAFSLWPNKGEPDPRPAQEEGYRRVERVAPKSPAVPADAPAALRTPPA
ncbi:FAD-dependent oxidoreductase [Saccharopolyspora erythraea]|uniref:Cholesterol oxidase n=2 Tax=Saccharopolyspora erythraea TaxID=1836 RepID=A4FP96_SACEN|nr:GMC family oxidoreductase [Saccharopolyspora erythraea]EQD86672.1 cholesterol oxidase [Saccharopolyspora erythraea D]QRK89415.1 GMC family oxidoreductase [Saccharopolyspora erythraea]CAM05871.1 cholesterol oxidase [Saccharopolyspora erythraea NRRL 2338]